MPVGTVVPMHDDFKHKELRPRKKSLSQILVEVAHLARTSRRFGRSRNHQALLEPVRQSPPAVQSSESVLEHPAQRLGSRLGPKSAMGSTLG